MDSVGEIETDVEGEALGQDFNLLSRLHRSYPHHLQSLLEQRGLSRVS